MQRIATDRAVSRNYSPWRRLLTLICVSIALGGCATRQGWQLTEGQHARKHEREISKTVRSNFLLFLPKGVAEDPQRRWPLIVFLHGAGERGDDLEKLKAYGPPKLVESDPTFPFIVVSPQVPFDPAFMPDAFPALLDDIVRELPVDEDRIYLTGVSMGGFATWAWAMVEPWRFAAIAPIASGWEHLEDACKLKDIPIWAFHGAKDGAVPIDLDQKMVDAVKACGGNIRFTIYPDAEHDSWTQTYNNSELFDWFLRHRRRHAD